MTEDQVLHMLSAVPAGYKIRLDGDDLRDSMTRQVICIAVRKGWLELGDQPESPLASWFNAEITAAGRAAIATIDHGEIR